VQRYDSAYCEQEPKIIADELCPKHNIKMFRFLMFDEFQI